MEKVGARGQVVAVDLADMEPVAGAEFIVFDFLVDGADSQIADTLGGPADVVLSDMAAPSTGVASVDHLRIMGLCEAALAFARTVLAANGAFVAKVLQGGGEGELVAALKRDFRPRQARQAPGQPRRLVGNVTSSPPATAVASPMKNDLPPTDLRPQVGKRDRAPEPMRGQPAWRLNAL